MPSSNARKASGANQRRVIIRDRGDVRSRLRHDNARNDVIEAISDVRAAIMGEFTTFEAFILEAAGFRDHAEVTVFAHAPFNREFRLTIPAALGGTNRSIDWLRLCDALGAGDARFTVDADMNVLAWRCGELNYSAL